MAYNKETGMYEGFIYKIWNDIDDEFYIGRTYRTVKKRWKEHLKSSEKSKTDLYDAMREYGAEHFNIEIVERLVANTKNEIRELCIEKEISWIKYYRDNYYSIYNMTDGGDDVKQKMFPERPVIQYDLFCNELARYNSIAEASEASGINNSDIGKCCYKDRNSYCTDNYIWRYIEEPLTDDEIKELNQRYKGICQYDFDGNLINTFYRPKDAINYIKLTEGMEILPSNISACTNGKCVSAAGYVWRYRDEPFDKYPILRHIKKVCQYDYDGNLINIYNDCSEASIITGVDKTSINQCCLGNYKKAGGYIWCYEGDMCNTDIKFIEQSVDRYDLNNNYIDSYNSITDASNILKINHQNISAVCRGKRKTAGGYIWKYKNSKEVKYA